MNRFQLPEGLLFNRGKIADPEAYVREVACASWLSLTGEEFAAMGGISYAQIRDVVEHAANVVSDPPCVLDLDLARRHVETLDALPRPTLITCRTGPRASAVAYMYAGLVSDAEPAEVLAAAERDEAPFCGFDEYKTWVVNSMEALSTERH